MNLIQQRRLARLAKQNAQKEAAKPAVKQGVKKTVSKFRATLQQNKAETVAPAKKSEKIDDLESQVGDVEGSVDELKNDVESQSEISNDLENVKDDVSNLDDRADWVEREIEKIKEKLGDESEYIGNPELETQKAILAASIDEMLNVEDIEDRKAYKAEAIVKLIDFVNGYVSSAAKYPNIVAVWVMIWLFDLGDIARALPLALHLAKQKIHNMPMRFKSEIETFICDQMYDWASAQLKANKSAGPYLEQVIQAIESDKWQLPDVVHGKMYAMHGKHLDALAENEAALKAYEKAMEINPRAGVKKSIERLTATLAKTKES